MTPEDWRGFFMFVVCPLLALVVGAAIGIAMSPRR